MTFHHIFGPVASRRLGRSLGIDLLPFKTCSYNCVYCECGKTTDHRTRRQEFFPPTEILEELDQILDKKPNLDYITFAGSGEPTLSLSIGQIINHLKDQYPGYRVAVLTNGSLLHLPEVRNELIRADLIIPTFSSACQETHEKIHRPCPGLTVSSLIDGIVHLREVFSGQIWIEVFLVPSLNTPKDELLSIRKTILQIRPDKIQLNALDRPGTESWITSPEPSEIESIRSFFAETGIDTEIIGTNPPLPYSSYDTSVLARIEETLQRRPCTVDDIARMTGLRQNEVMKKIAELLKQGVIQTKHGERGTFYSVADER